MKVKKVTSPPPPPPRRKYKSVAVGTESIIPSLGFSTVHIEDIKPKKKEKALDSSPKILKEQFQKFQIRLNASTQTDLKENSLIDNHSQTDTVTIDDKSTSVSPECADFTTNTHILGVDVITQIVLDCIDSATSTDGLLHPGVDRSTTTEYLTVDKAVSFKPITSDFTCYAKINSGVSVATATDISIERGTSAVQCDAAIQFTPMVSDFSVNVSPVVDDASVSANLRPNCKDTASQIQCETTNVGVLTECLVADAGCDTEVVEQKEVCVSVAPVTADFEVQFYGTKNTYDAYTNTVSVEKQDFEMQFQPVVVNCAVDPITQVDASKIDFSVQFRPAVIDRALDPITTESKDMIVQVELKTIEVGVDCRVDMIDASLQVENDDVQLERNSTVADGRHEQDVKNTHSRLRDVATDTSDLNYSPFDSNEIVTYVGQASYILHSWNRHCNLAVTLYFSD